MLQARQLPPDRLGRFGRRRHLDGGRRLFRLGGRLGAYKGDKIENYKIRFTGYAKEWIKNHKFADNQTFTEDEESTTITFSSSQFEKVFEAMLSWGRQAEPLAPADLVTRWKDEIRAMAKLVK